MARPKLDIVVEVEDRKSSEGIETPSKCIGSDMRKTLKSKLKIRNREYLEFDLFLVDSKSTDDADWEEWRNSLSMTIGGHTFGGMVGFGADNQSAHKHFCRFMGLSVKEEANWFGKRAREHGKEKELVVKKHLSLFPLQLDDGCYENESLLYELVSKKSPDFPLLLCVTPDLLTKFSVYEIKCPYYNAENFENPRLFKRDVEERNLKKYGARINPSWWLQAAFYAYITGKQFFCVIVCYYTIATDMYLLSYWHFKLDDEAREYIRCELRHILAKAEEYSADPQKLLEKKHKPCFTKKNILIALIEASMYFSDDTPIFEWHMNGTITMMPGPTSIIDVEDFICRTKTNLLRS